jgi:hypothetical protein
LANYAANLPDRAGTFQPLTSAWDRLLGSSHHKTTGIPKDILCPTEEDLKLAALSSNSPLKLHKYDPDGSGSRSSAGEVFEFKKSPEFLKKGSQGHARLHARMGRKPREVVKFRPLGEGELSSDSEDGDIKKPVLGSPAGSGGNAKPWLKQKPSMSSTSVTLIGDGSGGKGGSDEIDYQKEMRKLGRLKKNGMGEGEVPEYSDFEEDLTNVSVGKGVRADAGDNGEGWSPGFLKRHQLGNGRSRGGNRVLSSVSQGTAVDPVTPTTRAGSPPLGAVPVTPSLMKALDRIAVAQKDAFGGDPSGGNSEGLGGREGGYKGPRWDDFWKEVKEKARI